MAWRTKEEIMKQAEQVAGTHHTSEAEISLIQLEVLLDIRALLRDEYNERHAAKKSQ